MIDEASPRLGKEEQRIVEDFVDASDWMVAQRTLNGRRGYYALMTNVNGIQTAAGGDIWTAPIDDHADLPEGLYLLSSDEPSRRGFAAEHLARVSDFGTGNGVAPPVDRFGGVKGYLMGNLRAPNRVEEFYRPTRGMVAPSESGELKIVDFAMTPAVVAPDNVTRTKQVKGQPYNQHFPRTVRRGERIPYQAVEYELVRSGILKREKLVPKEVTKYREGPEIVVPPRLERVEPSFEIRDPGSQRLVLDGTPYVFSRIFAAEDHRQAITPEQVAAQMRDLMIASSLKERKLVDQSVKLQIYRRHPQVTAEHYTRDGNRHEFTSNF